MEGNTTPIRLIYTGGTIGAAGSPLAPLPGPAFRALFERLALPALDARGTTPPLDWIFLEPAIDSTEAAPPDWARLARAVLDPAPKGPVIVLHGTDTLANTAAALDLLLAHREEGRRTGMLAAPVIMTGSMQPLFAGEALREGGDALENLATALATALGAAARGVRGIQVAFAGHVLPGHHLLKVETGAPDAFAAPAPLPPPPALPGMPAGPILAALDALTPHLGKRAVPVFTPSPEAPAHQAALLSAVVDGMGERLGALILAGFGQGNLPAAAPLSPILCALRDRGVPVLLTTAVPAGGVAPEAYAAGAWLADCAVIPGGVRTIPALHAAAHVALAHGAAHAWSAAGLRDFLRAEIGGAR